MDVALQSPMSRDEFFAWAQAQDQRYEFDGYRPVAMTGGNLGHGRLVRNINRQLANRLTGKNCESLGPDAGVATVGNVVRYPDAVVTCSKFDNGDHLVPNPVVVFEVVSPSSIRIDRIIKLREYQLVPSIRRYILVESDAAAITVLSRDGEHEPFSATGLAEGEVLQLPELDIELPLAAIYEAVDFP